MDIKTFTTSVINLTPEEITFCNNLDNGIQKFCDTMHCKNCPFNPGNSSSCSYAEFMYALEKATKGGFRAN